MTRPTILRMFIPLLALIAQVYGSDMMVAEIKQYGITWKFDQPVRAGKFVNGDWWGVPNSGQAAVTVISVDPPPTKTSDGKLMNGSMVNPMVGWQAMDERCSAWKADLGCSLWINCANHAMHQQPGLGKYAVLDWRPLVIANVLRKKEKLTSIARIMPESLY